MLAFAVEPTCAREASQCIPRRMFHPCAHAGSGKTAEEYQTCSSPPYPTFSARACSHPFAGWHAAHGVPPAHITVLFNSGTMFLLVLFAMHACTDLLASLMPVLVQDTADPSPEFPEIAFSAAANSISERHLSHQSKVRILVLSHARQQLQGQDVCSTCDTRGHRAGWKNGACPTCTAQRDTCPLSCSSATSPAPAKAQDGTVEGCASCLPPQVPFQWICTPLPGTATRRDNVHGSHSSWQQESTHTTNRRSGALPTIRESRSFNYSSRMSVDSPADSSARGSQAGCPTGGANPVRDGSSTPSSCSTAEARETSGGMADGEKQVTARVSVEGSNHCIVQLDISCPSAQRSSACSLVAASEGPRTSNGVAGSHMHSTSGSDSASSCNRAEIASSALCTWELKALNPQDGECLVDASLDLTSDLTPAQMPFSSMHCCSVLPMRTLMLGLGTATHVGAARHAIVNSGVQPAGLFLHPKLPERALSQFIEDNKRTKKVTSFVLSLYALAACVAGQALSLIHI